MQHVMLDIDGTLTQSYELDSQCFVDAVYEATGLHINDDWGSYLYVTDRGILKTFIEHQAPQYSLDELERIVKPIFIRNTQQALDKKPTQAVDGAKTFVSYLLQHPQYIVSIATGGWGETALLKLLSAGFDVNDVVLASSNDHYSRIKIMGHAWAKADATLAHPITYFGDGAWDVKACNTLGINLVIVGHRVEHHQRIENFASLEQALRFIQ